MDTYTVSWREAREHLTESGMGVNDAQQVLEDLIWRASFPKDRPWSYKFEDRVRYLRFSGLDKTEQPQYETRNSR